MTFTYCDARHDGTPVHRPRTQDRRPHVTRSRRNPPTMREYFELKMPGPLAGDECAEWPHRVNNHGYGVVVFERKQHYAHRVSYELHNGPIPDGLHVLHSCHNPACVNPNHLRVGTPADNTVDKLQAGRQAQGDRHGHSKLSEELVRAIRGRYAAGGIRQKDLAAEYGVHINTIAAAILGKTWKCA